MKIIPTGEKGILDAAGLQRVCDVLRQGGVVMHATETCYGFACDITNEEALRRLYELKKMDEAKPVSVMVASVEQGRGLGDFSDEALRVAERFWPGALTIIVPRRHNGGLPVFLNPGADSVGVRCPDFLLARHMVESFGGPLTTTSANISGEPQVYKVGDFLQQLKLFPIAADFPLLIVDSGEIPMREPSTIIRFFAEKPGYELVRRGDLANEVENFVHA